MQEKIALAIPRDESPIEYDIVVGTNLLGSLAERACFADYSKVLLVVDQALQETIEPLIAPLLNQQVTAHYLECGEQHKNISHLESLLEVFQKAKLDRRSLTVNIGGGMLGDLAGFAASMYMRGISFIQVPTTLLAQVDASVGGKVAINFAGVKNLIGAFQQPRLVLIDVSLLKSLPKREFYSGFAEIIKHGLIYDQEFISDLEKLEVDALSEQQLVEVIRHSCQIKADVVSQDPHENGLRKILNFGHTIAHAIESLATTSSTPLLHGECVSLGMVAESYIAKARGTLREQDCARIQALLAKYHLPIRLTQQISVDSMIEKMKLDKKNALGQIAFALPSPLGKCQPATTASETEIRQALKVLFS